MPYIPKAVPMKSMQPPEMVPIKGGIVRKVLLQFP